MATVTDEPSDFGPVVHRESGAVLDVRPAQPGGSTTPGSYRFGARVFLRKRPERWPLPGSCPVGQGWQYDGRKLVADGGGSFILTAMFVQSDKAAYAGYEPGGAWEVMLCNHESSSNHTAVQQWDVLKDGTIRVHGDRARCLAPVMLRREGDIDPDGGFRLTVVDYDPAQHTRFVWCVRFSSPVAISRTDQCVGLLLGAASGDSLGSPFEGWTAQEIAIMHPAGVRSLNLRRDLRHAQVSLEAGHLTDRATLLLSLTASLCECRGVDPQHAAQRAAEFFAVRSLNGHAPLFGATAPILQRMVECHSGGTWGPASFAAFDPVANAFDGAGAAARAAPVGVALAHASDNALREAVCNAVLTADADFEAALLVAKAAASLARRGGASGFDAREWLEALADDMEGVVEEPLSLGHKLASNADTYDGIWLRTDGQPPSTARPDWYVARLRALAALLDEVERSVAGGAAERPRSGHDAAEIHALEEANGLRHGSCSPFPGRAVDVVPIALWNFALLWRTPCEALAGAVAAGGDTAGAGVICGALLGTLHGPSWVPRSWFSLLDNGLHGRDFAIRTGKLLAEAFPSPFDVDWARSDSAEPMARVGALHSNCPDQE